MPQAHGHVVHVLCCLLTDRVLLAAAVALRNDTA